MRTKEEMYQLVSEALEELAMECSPSIDLTLPPLYEIWNVWAYDIKCAHAIDRIRVVDYGDDENIKAQVRGQIFAQPGTHRPSKRY